MDTFELNKILGAILGSLLFTMGLGFAAEILYAPAELEQQAYLVEVEQQQGGHGEAAQADSEPMAVVLAAGDAARGESDAKKCGACHTFESGGANKIGPNLHGIVGRAKASANGFKYSSAMQAKAGETWTYEDLYGFIAAPKGWLPGTSMAFAGLKKAEDRADVIAYLRTISPDAPPLPEPEQQGAAQPSAAAPAAEPSPAAPVPAQSSVAAPAPAVESAAQGSSPAGVAEGDGGVAVVPESGAVTGEGAEAGAETPAATPELVAPKTTPPANPTGAN